MQKGRCVQREGGSGEREWGESMQSRCTSIIMMGDHVLTKFIKHLIYLLSGEKGHEFDMFAKEDPKRQRQSIRGYNWKQKERPSVQPQQQQQQCQAPIKRKLKVEWPPKKVDT